MSFLPLSLQQERAFSAMRFVFFLTICLAGLASRTEAAESYGPGKVLVCGHRPYYVIWQNGRPVEAPMGWGNDKAEPAAIDYFAWSELSKFMVAGDKVGNDELRKQKKLLDIPSGTLVQILSVKTANNIPAYETRIKEGPLKDKVVYLPESALWNIPVLSGR